MTCMFYCDFTNVSTWAHSTFVLDKCQVFTGPRQFRKNVNRQLFRDDADKLVPILCQLMAHKFYFESTIGLAWARLTLVLSKCQHFTGPRQLEKEIKRRLFRDHTDNFVLKFGQLMAHAFYSVFTMISPELVRLLSWTRANILPALVSSGKISNEGCFVMTRRMLSRDSANWWLVDFILDSPWSFLSSFDCCPEKVPIF